MITTFIKIRFFQFLRLLNGIGLIRILIVSIMLFLVSIMIYELAILPEHTVKMSIIFGLLLSVHSTRRDKYFLKATLKNPYPIYLSEYFLLTLPLLVIWIITFNWTEIGILLLIVLLTPLISVNLKLHFLGSFVKFLMNPFNSDLNSKFKVRLPFISVRSFEWISGIRKNLILLVPVYLLFLAFSFKPYVAVVGVILISILISGFYYQGEPREFIEFFAENPGDFIKHKIGINLKQLIILYVPMLLIALIFQIHTWHFLIGAVIISFLIQVLAIIFKYSLFEENANLNRNSMILYLNILFIMLPFFWPAPIIMGIKHYNKALENLKQYFDD